MAKPRVSIPTDTILGQLIQRALVHLEALHYGPDALEKYRSAWRMLLKLARQEPVQTECSDELVRRIFAWYRVPDVESGKRLSTWQCHIRTCVRILREFALRGCHQRQKGVTEKTKLPLHCEELVQGYEKFALKLGHRPRTLWRRRRTVVMFLHFLASKGDAALERITPALLSEFASSRIHLHPRSVALLVSDLRSFLRYLLMRGILERDIRDDLPKIRVYRDAHIPTIWSRDDVTKLLAAVDRGSPKGKRDYAILLMTSRLGMRVGDIRTLRLEHLDWEQARLRMPQSKTGVSLDLPLPEDVGEALIDYLRHGRPKSAHREVFLLARAPYGPLYPTNNLHRVIALWRRRAGIPAARPRGRQGLHSLRHTLATRLLEAGTPLQTIANIIGHLSLESTRKYTKVNVAALQSVAIDPDEVARA